MTQDLISTIHAKKTAAAAKVSKLRTQLEAIERELQEYETTLKVLEQVTISAAQGAASGASSAIGRSDSDGPTMPDLIMRALETGPKPIADVTATVTVMGEKPVDANNIRSTAWRMWKAGRISKTGDVYHLNNHRLEHEPDDFEDLIG